MKKDLTTVRKDLTMKKSNKKFKKSYKLNGVTALRFGRWGCLVDVGAVFTSLYMLREVFC